MIEQLLIFSRKRLSGKIVINNFHLYPHNSNKNENGYYENILEIIIEEDGEYMRFSNQYGSATMEKYIIEVCQNLQLITKHYFEGYRYIGVIERFSELEIPDAKIEETRFNQMMVNDLTTSEISIPSYFYTIMNCYSNLSDKEYPIFRKSLYLYLVGIELHGKYKSMAIISFISAIENLMNYFFKNVKVETCKECGQKIYSIRQKYLNFLSLFGGENKKLYDSFYSLRSKIAHDDFLIMQDKLWSYDFDYAESSDGYMQLTNIEMVVRVAMINWLGSEIKQDPKDILSNHTS